MNIESERAAFEVFVRSDAWMFAPDLTRNPATEDYWDVEEQTGWISWQARAALTASAPNDQYRELVWMAHQLADMVLKGDAPHTAVRVAKSLMRECEGKSSAPNHSEQVRGGFLLAKETVVELPGGSKELGYTPMPGLGVFFSNDEVFAAIRELGLPLGWVSVRLDQVIAAPSAGSQERGE